MGAACMCDRLDVENMVVRIIAKAFEGSTDKKEQWYGTDYSEAAFTGDQVQHNYSSCRCSACSVLILCFVLLLCGVGALTTADQGLVYQPH